MKFKGKKKRKYQGFVDDGFKLINEKDVIVTSTIDITMSSAGNLGGVISDTRIKRTAAMKSQFISIAP